MEFKFLVLIVLLIHQQSVNCQDRCRVQRARNAIFKRLGDVNIQTLDGNAVKTFFISRILKTNFPTAQLYCKEYQMEMVSLDSKTEETALLSYLTEQGSNYTGAFIGMINAGTVDSWFQVKTGKLVDYPMAWHAGQPSAEYALNKNRCGAIWYNQNLRLISQAECTADWHIICQELKYKEQC